MTIADTIPSDKGSVSKVFSRNGEQASPGVRSKRIIEAAKSAREGLTVAKSSELSSHGNLFSNRQLINKEIIYGQSK